VRSRRAPWRGRLQPRRTAPRSPTCGAPPRLLPRAAQAPGQPSRSRAAGERTARRPLERRPAGGRARPRQRPGAAPQRRPRLTRPRRRRAHGAAVPRQTARAVLLACLVGHGAGTSAQRRMRAARRRRSGGRAAAARPRTQGMQRTVGRARGRCPAASGTRSSPGLAAAPRPQEPRPGRGGSTAARATSALAGPATADGTLHGRPAPQTARRRLLVRVRTRTPFTARPTLSLRALRTSARTAPGTRTPRRPGRRGVLKWTTGGAAQRGRALHSLRAAPSAAASLPAGRARRFPRCRTRRRMRRYSRA